MLTLQQDNKSAVQAKNTDPARLEANLLKSLNIASVEIGKGCEGFLDARNLIISTDKEGKINFYFRNAEFMRVIRTTQPNEPNDSKVTTPSQPGAGVSASFGSGDPSVKKSYHLIIKAHKDGASHGIQITLSEVPNLGVDDKGLVVRFGVTAKGDWVFVNLPSLK